MEEASTGTVPRPDAFVGSLLNLEREQDREALAHLRGVVRGSTGDLLRAAKYVAPFLGETGYPSDRWFYLVGGFFAYHPLHSENSPSLGAALGRLRGESGSTDGRVLALLGTSSEALDKPLFQAISLLRAKGIGLNYFRLLRDLSFWGHDDNAVQKRWARDYFRSSKSDTETNESENSDES